MTAHNNEQRGTQAHAQLWELIKDIRFAMFTVRDRNGHLTARPMTTQNSASDEDACLWFFMPRSGDTVAHLSADSSVNVVYADPAKDSYVSVSGTATVTDDAGKKERLWTKMTQAWFPGGPADPNLALVQVKIAHAEYWDVDTNQAVQLLKMAKAVATGKAPDMGTHGEVHMA